jgi:two-component system chemotaxis response regulator CheY
LQPLNTSHLRSFKPRRAGPFNDRTYGEELPLSATVMVVDDSLMTRKQVCAALGGAFQICEAVDGVDALEKMTGDTVLVICDIHMPRMSGLELLEAVRREGKYQPRFLMLTTEGKTDVVERAKTLGASGWIVKPFNPLLLTKAVAKLTRA